MEKKSGKPPISNAILKTLNKNYVSEPIQDESRNEELMSFFIQGEMDKINSILATNELFNFKDSKGSTLIHEILKNESVNITEEDKLNVIKKLINKNVSLNAITLYNQNVLHLACEKGYNSIIEYLLKKNCNQYLIDNYGNAPIHYLIDKFIIECKQEDFYKDSNHYVKPSISPESKKIFDVLKYESIVILIKEVDNKILNTIKNFTESKTQLMLPLIYDRINIKKLEINKIFTDSIESMDDKYEKAKNELLNINNELRKIYDYDIDSVQNWDNFINQQNNDINGKKQEIINNINKKITEIDYKINKGSKLLDEINEKYYQSLIKYTSGMYFIKEILSLENKQGIGILYNNNDGTMSTSLLRIDNTKFKEIKNVIDNKFLYLNNNINIFINGIDKDKDADINKIYYQNKPINQNTVYNFSFKFNDKLEYTGIPFNSYDNILIAVDDAINAYVNYKTYSAKLKTALDNAHTVIANLALVTIPYLNKSKELDDIADTSLIPVLNNKIIDAIVKKPNAIANILSNNPVAVIPEDALAGLENDSKNLAIILQANLATESTIINVLDANLDNAVKAYTVVSKFYKNGIKNDKKLDDINFSHILIPKLANAIAILAIALIANYSSKLIDTNLNNTIDTNALITNFNNNINILNSIFTTNKYLAVAFNSIIKTINQKTNIKKALINIAATFATTFITSNPAIATTIVAVNHKVAVNFVKTYALTNPKFAAALVAALFAALYNYDSINTSSFATEFVKNHINVAFKLSLALYANPAVIETIINTINSLFIQQNIITYTKSLYNNYYDIPSFNTKNMDKFVKNIYYTIFYKNDTRPLINATYYNPTVNDKNKNFYEVFTDAVIDAFTAATAANTTIFNNVLNINNFQYLMTALYAIASEKNIFIDTVNNIRAFINDSAYFNNFITVITNNLKALNAIPLDTPISDITKYYYYDKNGTRSQQNVYIRMLARVYITKDDIRTIVNNAFAQVVTTYNFVTNTDNIDILAYILSNDKTAIGTFIATSPIFAFIIINSVSDYSQTIAAIVNNSVVIAAIAKRNPTELITVFNNCVTNKLLDINKINSNNLVANYVNDIKLAAVEAVANINYFDDDNNEINTAINDIANNDDKKSSFIKAIANHIAYTAARKAIIAYTHAKNSSKEVDDAKKNYNDTIALLTNFVSKADAKQNDAVTVDVTIKYIKHDVATKIKNSEEETMINAEKYLKEVEITKNDIDWTKINFINLINKVDIAVDATVAYNNAVVAYDNAKVAYDNAVIEVIKNPVIENNLPTDIHVFIPQKIQSNGNESFVKDYIEKQEITYYDEKYFSTKQTNYFQYSPLRVLFEYIKNLMMNISDSITIIKDKDEKYIEFDIVHTKNIMIMVTKIINNLIILEKYIDNIDFDNLYANIKSVNDKISIIITSDNTLSNDEKKIFVYLFEIINMCDTFVEYNKKQNNLIIKSNYFNKEYKKQISDIYTTIIGIFDVINVIIENINKYQSLCQLEKYVEYVGNYINKSSTVNLDIDNTFYNNYNYDVKFPPTFEEYKKNYFSISDDKNIYTALENDIIFNNEYLINFYRDICPYINTYNYNTIYNTSYNSPTLIIYNNFKIDSTNNKIVVNNNNYNFVRNSKFVRGYNALPLIDNTIILEKKSEINDLCDMEILKKIAIVVVTDKVTENMYGIFNLRDKLIINLNFKSNIITHNFQEVINLIIYFIYQILIKKNTDFFNIDLNKYKYDKTTTDNIKSTLKIIKSNEEEKHKYIINITKSAIKLLIENNINNEILKISDEILKSVKLKISTIKTDLAIENPTVLEIIQNDSTKLIEEKNNINLKENRKNIVKKIIDNKCLNTNKTNELLNLKFDYTILDSNGDTVLTRLIDQFNYYGINKILEIEKNKLLTTYKNYRQETPSEYLLKAMKIIQDEYETENFKNRIDNYSLDFFNSIQSNNEYINMIPENLQELMKEISINSIYLFNEVLWLKLYDYSTDWTLDNKNNLKEILNIKDKEELLITTLNNDDMVTYMDVEKNKIITKINNEIELINDKIYELEEKKKKYNEETNNVNSILHKKNINVQTQEIDNKINDEKKKIKEHKTIIYDINNINPTDINDTEFKKYVDKLLDIKNTTINWDEYYKLVNYLGFDYFRILKVINEKPKDSISNFLIKLFNYDTKSENSELIGNYFKLIFDNLFADYWDLDKYEDSYYNVINISIIEILKINVIEIIEIQLLNTLLNYNFKLVNKNKDTNIMIEYKLTNKNIKKNKFENLSNSINKYLYICLITKLDMKNPNKSNYIDIDTQKKVIISEVEKKLDEVINNKKIIEFTEQDKINIDKIIEFNKFICESIGLKCYNEIIKILSDGKKISIYYEMYNTIQKSENDFLIKMS